MPTFDDPVADADEAREALRALAHASRRFEHPSHTYGVIGDLVAGVRSLRQALDQLATAHTDHRAWARVDTSTAIPTRTRATTSNTAAGAASADAAAAALRDAAALLDRADTALDEAWQQSGRIAWQPPPPSTRRRDSAGIGERRAARPRPTEAFTSPTRQSSPNSGFRGPSL